MTDGPFLEAKEVLGGCWTIQVWSRTETIDWATALTELDARALKVLA